MTTTCTYVRGTFESETHTHKKRYKVLAQNSPWNSHRVLHRVLIRFLCYGVQEAGEFLLPGVVHLALLLAQPQAKSESTAGECGEIF